MIEWIVTSSAQILLVLVLRLLVRERVSPRLRYALWALVLLRLLIPVSLWESPASVLNAAQTNDGYQLVSTLPDHMEMYENGNWRSVAGPEGTFKMEPGAAGRWEDEQPRLYNAYGWAAVRDAEEAQSLREQGQKAVDNTALKWMVDVQSVLRTVWRSGVWLTEGFLLVVNLKFYLDLRKKRCPDGTYQGRDIYIVDGLPTPCLFGLFRPGIYLRPEVAENETARMHVLAHEYIHFRQWDHIWAVLRGVCLALHWYNPLVWLAAVLSRRDCELSCDEGAVRLLGEEHRADYGRTLVGLVARRTIAADLACCATTMTGGKSALKERIALLVKRPRTTAVMACVVAVACAVFTVCTFTGAAEADEPDEPEEPAQTEPAPEIDPVLVTENRFMLDIPDDLPTELMDLSLPAEEQGEWLLLAQAPYTDASLYCRADDDQHVYLRLTNQCFQRFNRDLRGMELLPTMDLWDGEAELAIQVLYRRYEGTYFNGKTYEPGIVADMVIYDWNVEGKYWEEKRIISQPPQNLTEDLLPLADLPTWTLDTPGAGEYPIWLLGEIPGENIAVYYEKSDGRSWLRYGDRIQPVEGVAFTTSPLILPELYFDDLDGDGDRELIAISQENFAAGISRQQLSVYEWNGESWTWAAHRPEQTENSFNSSLTYQFYDDGTAYIRCQDADLLLDLSGLWEDGYWDNPPTLCCLTASLTSYTYQDGKLAMTMGGEIIEAGGVHLHGHAFDYVCPIVYNDYGNGECYLSSWDGELRSEFAVERPDVDASRLTPAFRRILMEFIEECRQISGGGGISGNRFAILDVNGDGKDELITQLNSTITAGQVERVYDADGNELLAAYPMMTYYDNGYIAAGWSHNQGAAGDKLWPYTLFRYDPNVNAYTKVASVDGWDKSLRDSYLSYDESTISFPDGIDRDGDGFVYYIIEEEGGYAPVYGRPMDNADYALWASSYLSGDVAGVHYAPLTEENIALIQ